MCKKYLFILIKLEIGVNNTIDIACLNKSLNLQEKQSFVFKINVLSLILILVSNRIYWNRNIDLLVS